MKRLIAGAIIIANLLSLSANAAWEFEEKELAKRMSGGLGADGVIWLYDQTGTGQDMWSIRELYFDINGNPVDKSEVTGAYPQELKSFTNNEQSFIGYGTVYNEHGKVLAEGVTAAYGHNFKFSVVLEGRKYGIMSYDGKLVVPCEYDGIVLLSEYTFWMKKGEEEILCRYDGNYGVNTIFTAGGDISIFDAGKDMISVMREVEEKRQYALMDTQGRYLTDFCDEIIYVYENSESWQSGDFARFYNEETRQSRYVDYNLNDIEDICSQDNVYCKSYYEFADTALIENDDYYALYDKVNKSFIIPYTTSKLQRCGNNALLFGSEKVLNEYGEELFCFSGTVDAMSGFKDSLAIVHDGSGKWVVDITGEKIFSKSYGNMVYQIDNNEFFVVENSTGKILTAKGIIGEALNTDVKVNINGVEIPCCSVYGSAAVKAEDLRDFGFDVTWDGEDRMLRIYRNPNYHLITAESSAQTGEAGTHYADIYGSDINVEYDGKRINSYCIDGETLIKIEELESDTVSFRYDNSVRTLYMDINGLERK